VESELTYAEAEAILQRLADRARPARPAPGPPPPAEPTPSPLPLATGNGQQEPPASVQEQLARVRGRFGDVLEALPDAVVIVNRSGLIVLVNAQTEQLFGYSREELVGQPVELLVPEALRDRHVGLRDGYFAHPHTRPMGANLELHGQHRDGRDLPVEISLSPVQSEDGLLVVSSIRDISARKKAEAQLRQMEARYRTLVEGIPAVTFMAALDEDLNELYVSPQIEQLLGFSQQEWLENPVLWYTQLHPDDQARWHLEFAHTCATGEPFRSVYRFLARDGRVVWVHGEAKLVRDAAGRPQFLQGVAFDITGMKQAEDNLRALNETLEQRVAKRTAEAEQRAHELARSNAELEKFAYVASHDLREPLRTLKSYPKLLAQRYHGKLDAKADDQLNRIIVGADNMERLINDLSKYSRVVRGERSLAATDCASVFVQACANLQAALEESGAQVTPGPLPVVLGNETELELLFQNLIGNAVKFRAEGRAVRIHFGAQPHGDGWLFSVSDNGIGIEERYLRRIFELGERLNSKRLYPGTGFGLAICEKIVEAHGGRIWAESEFGQGSTFYFTLPAPAPLQDQAP
jgi:PAS domain S-box-containing protein